MMRSRRVLRDASTRKQSHVPASDAVATRLQPHAQKIVILLVGLVATLTIVTVAFLSMQPSQEPAELLSAAATSVSLAPAATGSAATGNTACGEVSNEVVAVQDGDELRAAIAGATPGTTIHLADGIYTGRFALRQSGTPTAPITLCGGRDARLRGASIERGYGLLVEGDYWHIEGITIQHFLKGIEAHGTTGTVIRGVEIHDIGQEGIHLRDSSSANTVEWNVISDTGRHRPEWGEGIYIGSDSRQWCANIAPDGTCTVDASDDNVIQFNTIGPGIGAELIDVKEGTRHGTLRGNVLLGDPDSFHEDVNALVSIKGNDWLIIGNTGSGAPEHGMRVNTDDLEGWGVRNVFIDNTLDVGADGYGFRLPLGPGGVPLDNTVACANTVIEAGSGFANVECVTDVVVP